MNANDINFKVLGPAGGEQASGSAAAAVFLSQRFRVLSPFAKHPYSQRAAESCVYKPMNLA